MPARAAPPRIMTSGWLVADGVPARLSKQPDRRIAIGRQFGTGLLQDVGVRELSLQPGSLRAALQDRRPARASGHDGEAAVARGFLHGCFGQADNRHRRYFAQRFEAGITKTADKDDVIFTVLCLGKGVERGMGCDGIGGFRGNVLCTEGSRDAA